MRLYKDVWKYLGSIPEDLRNPATIPALAVHVKLIMCIGLIHQLVGRQSCSYRRKKNATMYLGADRHRGMNKDVKLLKQLRFSSHAHSRWRTPLQVLCSAESSFHRLL